MKSFNKISQYVFKTYISLLVLFVISCGSRNSQNGSYRSTTVSYYANKFEGNKTASGEIYRHSRMTGAHKSIAFGTRVEIVNIENNKSVIVTINDRGALKPSREFDLSQHAFKKIADLNEGTVKVKYRILK